MKLDSIFLGVIKRITKYDCKPGCGDTFVERFNHSKIDLEFYKVKNAILKREGFNYRDIETNQLYRAYFEDEGDTFVDEETLVPFNSVLDESKKYMPKRKVLTIYNENKG